MKKILITSALPYINGIKHLGNLIGSQLPADVYARYMRATGHRVLYICATDEHGTPAELAAIEDNLTVEKFCEKMWHIQKKIADEFHISFDYFGRSSSKHNHELTQYFATKLWENNFLEEVNEKQFFSLKDKRYLPDRYITGAGLLNQEANFKIISKTLLVMVSIIKKNSAIIADIIKTITVVVIVSFLVGHTIFETSFLTC